MLKDRINLYSIYKDLRIRCFGCQKAGHLANSCNLLHYFSDREKVIKTFEFSFSQDRAAFIRNRLQKKPFMVFGPKEMKHFQEQNRIKTLMTLEEDSSDEADYDEDETREKNEHLNKTSIFSKQTSSKYMSQASAEMGKISPSKRRTSASNQTAIQVQVNSPQEENRFLDANAGVKLPVAPNPIEDSAQPGKRVSFKMPPPLIESRLKISSITAAISSSFISNYSNPGKHYSTASLSEKKIDSQDTEPEPNLRNGMEDFDVIHNFKKYFPDNNFSAIKVLYNENFGGAKSLRRKRRELLRLSQYTFSVLMMQEKLREKKKSMGGSSKRGAFERRLDLKEETKGKPNFISLVSTIVKNIRKEKAIKKKWFFPIWKLISMKNFFARRKVEERKSGKLSR